MRNAEGDHEAAPKPGRILGAGGTFRLDPPRLRTRGDPLGERHATWFELFFDLVFAAATSQLANALAADPTLVRLARFGAMFVLVDWAWVLYALYANRFDTDDLIFRLAKSGAMLAIAAGAVSLHQVMAGDGGTFGFAVSYLILRVLLIALYIRAGRHVDGEGRRLTRLYTAGYSATTVIWLLSILVPTPARCVLWGMAMLTDLAIPTRAWAVLSGKTVVVSHLTERFGAFFIIVLGVGWGSTITRISGLRMTPASWGVSGLCFLISLCLWWIYFDLADTSVVGRGRLGLVFVYGHFPLLAGIIVFGVGTKLVIGAAAHPALSSGGRWALSGGVAAFLLSLAGLHIGAEWTSMRDRTFISRIVLGVGLLVLAAVGSRVSPVTLVCAVALGVLGQLLLEAVSVRTGRASVVELPPIPSRPMPDLTLPLGRDQPFRVQDRSVDA